MALVPHEEECEGLDREYFPWLSMFVKRVGVGRGLSFMRSKDVNVSPCRQILRQVCTSNSQMTCLQTPSSTQKVQVLRQTCTSDR